MKCPPIDERENRQFEKLQHQAVTAILERSTFEHYCFLTQLTKTPGDPRPEELAFAVKGLLRCNFRQARQGMEWRRLFGTTKRWWHKKAWQELPLSWRSRVLFHTMPTIQEANEFISLCPLRLWHQEQACPHMSILNSAREDDNTWVLLQVEDVRLDDNQTFAQKLQQFLRSSASIFTYQKHCSCPDLTKLPRATFQPLADLAAKRIKIIWELEPHSLLHTGVSLDFAKAFFGQQREPHSRNLRLSCPDAPGQLTPALLVSSLKGVFRAAMAWLLEKIARDNGWAAQQHPCTSDYRSEKDKNLRCPLRAILGGPLPVEHPRQDTEKSEKGHIRFLAPHGSYFSGQVRVNWQQEENRFRFARRLLEEKTYQKKRDKKDQALLQIETIDLDSPHLITEITPGPHATAALLALCLAADLISAGFFRVGRFTTRGFGVVRLRPVSVDTGTLRDLLEDRGTEIPGADSGFALLTRTFEIADPIGQLASWLQRFAAASPGDAP